MKRINLLVAALAFGMLLSSCSDEDFIGAVPAEVNKLEDGELNGEKVYVAVEKAPEFPGGFESLYKHIANEMQYPKYAQERGIDGRVFVKFIVDKNGNVQFPQILKGLDESLDNEALRVISNLPQWEPGTQDGKEVNTYFTMPIMFRIE